MMPILLCAQGCGHRVSFMFGGRDLRWPTCHGEMMVREETDLGHVIESALLFLATQRYNYEDVRSAIEARTQTYERLCTWLLTPETGVMPDVKARIRDVLDGKR